MSKPLSRWSTDGGRIIGISDRDPLDQNYSKDSAENGIGHEAGACQSLRQGTALPFVKLGLALVTALALFGSLYWTISISTLSQVHIYRGYRRLQELLVSDLSEIGELSLGSTKLRELGFCSSEYEDFVPCYNNVWESLDAGDPDRTIEYERQCVRKSAEDHDCLVLPPRNYRIPIRWPSGRDFIWKENVKITGFEFSSGSLTKRMMVEEEQISFRSDSLMVDGVEDYSHQIAEMIGLKNGSNFNEAGVSTIFLITDGIFLIEVDRLLRPGGYFVWTSPTNTQRPLHDKVNQKKWSLVRDSAEKLCWDMLSQQDETIVWKKTTNKKCYSSRKSGPPLCDRIHDLESPYYQPLNPCVAGTRSQRWIPIEYRTPWPSQATLNSSELDIYGLRSRDFAEDALNWKSVVHNYWSLLSPLIFSDHPKRPGDEDPSPPFNMLRNVLDMNARFGGFNAALLDAGKTAWVMNVVPTSGPNYLPLIFDRGFVGVHHDWCEAFPTYPRTYDMVHAEGLLTLETHRQDRCSMLDIFLEIDRILRPEGWVILHDTATLTEAARSVITQLRWDARMLELDNIGDEKLLICQKPFFKKQQ
ncbi:putative pectin methyltransferase QUA2 [Cocos nucifera]|uniref:Methyltransferase n=1 Tax=Cocos nucifera TaxID=13894 RepID=A0A8K0MWT6_COCNU|nr:putative pectin methyltransferase QUA2 [Cocos nucifera]